MKTRKHNLNAIALGVALAMGSLTAQAAAPFNAPVDNPAQDGAIAIINAERGSTAPSFNTNEQVGLCLLESVVSLLATRTNDFTCDKETYDLSIYTDSPTTGTAEIDFGTDLGGTTLTASLGPKKDIGTLCQVDTVEGLNLLRGKEVVSYAGTHGWSRTNEIFNSDARITLKDRQTGTNNNYREVNIKDYFKRVIEGRSWEFDWGLEDIKKLRQLPTPFFYPVQKWQELSWYKHENGQEGGLWVRKQLMIPRSASACQIRVKAYDLFNGSGEFEMNGKVTVGQFDTHFGLYNDVVVAPAAP